MAGQIAKIGLAASAISIVASIYIFTMLSLIHISEPTRPY